MSSEQKKKAQSVLKSSLEAMKRVGGLAGDLIARLKKDESPEAMLATLEEGLKANRKRREDAAAEVERLHHEIAAKKKAYATAVPARKKIMETELRSLLAAYKSAENQLTVLLENERVLSTVKGRMLEVVSYDLATVTEDQIDDVIDRIEDAVEEAEARVDATRDLEKAGRRREREDDTEQLWDALKGFDEESEETSPLESELAGFEDEEESGKESAKGKTEEA